MATVASMKNVLPLQQALADDDGGASGDTSAAAPPPVAPFEPSAEDLYGPIPQRQRVAVLVASPFVPLLLSGVA